MSKLNNQQPIQFLERYNGPEFKEYCISEGKYLPATRDRSPCLSCPLFNLCDAGFEEQIQRIQRKDSPSLTDDEVNAEELTRDNLLSGLTAEQVEFVLAKIPDL